MSNKERNYPNLKNTIDSDFDKVKNYNSIMAKIDALNEKSLDEKNNTNKNPIILVRIKSQATILFYPETRVSLLFCVIIIFNKVIYTCYS